MTSTLLIVQIVLALAITVAVLLQKSSSIGLGAYSGSNESMFGAKGPMGILAKATFILALLFVLNTLALGYLYTKENNKSVVDTVKSAVPVSAETPTAVAPIAPSAPAVTTPTVPETTSSVPETTSAVPETTSAVPQAPAVDTKTESTEAPKPATH